MIWLLYVYCFIPEWGIVAHCVFHVTHQGEYRPKPPNMAAGCRAEHLQAHGNCVHWDEILLLRGACHHPYFITVDDGKMDQKKNQDICVSWSNNNGRGLALGAMEHHPGICLFMSSLKLFYINIRCWSLHLLTISESNSNNNSFVLWSLMQQLVREKSSKVCLVFLLAIKFSHFSGNGTSLSLISCLTGTVFFPCSKFFHGAP